MKRIYLICAISLLISCGKSGSGELTSPEPVVVADPVLLKLRSALKFSKEFAVWGETLITYNERINDQTSSITDGVLIAGNDVKFKYLNVKSVINHPNLAGYVIPQSTDYGVGDLKNVLANVASVEFLFSGSRFDALIFGYGSDFSIGNIQVEIDGKFTNISGYQYPPTNDGRPHYLNFEFKTVAVKRRIKIVYSGIRLFGGIVTDKNAVVEAVVPDNNLKLLVFGDSFTAGTGAENQFNKYLAYRVGDLLGFDNTIISGVGGTGYVNPNLSNVRKVFQQRITDITDAKPDAVIIAGGINDLGLAQPDEFAAITLLFLQTVSNALPNTEIFVTGPWWGSGVGYPQAHANAIQKSAAAVKRTHYIDVSTWITGNGSITSKNGSGNSDLYISSDKIHPSIAGHDYLARKLAAEIRKVIE
ncbi:MAG: SGNH/GDSL hydrolase family protein [Pedobacter sp.]|nr:MAG: SGNH/GDSL hydrolase family protein [Pedobacter sp.]